MNVYGLKTNLILLYLLTKKNLKHRKKKSQNGMFNERKYK